MELEVFLRCVMTGHDRAPLSYLIGPRLTRASPKAASGQVEASSRPRAKIPESFAVGKGRARVLASLLFLPSKVVTPRPLAATACTYPSNAGNSAHLSSRARSSLIECPLYGPNRRDRTRKPLSPRGMARVPQKERDNDMTEYRGERHQVGMGMRPVWGEHLQKTYRFLRARE